MLIVIELHIACEICASLVRGPLYGLGAVAGACGDVKQPHSEAAAPQDTPHAGDVQSTHDYRRGKDRSSAAPSRLQEGISCEICKKPDQGGKKEFLSWASKGEGPPWSAQRGGSL